MKKVIKWSIALVIVALVIFINSCPKTPPFLKVREIQEQYSNFYGMPVKEVLKILNVSKYDVYSSEDSQFSELIDEYHSYGGHGKLPKIDKVLYIMWEEYWLGGGYYAIFTYNDIVYGFDSTVLWD